MTDRFSLQGVHVAITGGARGIGAATAERLLRDGARVTLGDVDLAAVEATAARLGAVGLGLDVTERESFTAFLDAAEAAQGPLDVLINNAGIMPIGPFLEEPDDVARRLFDINVHGVILGMKIALPRMLARGRGHVVNLASAAGRMASLPGESTYVATKHAVVGLSEAVRCELEGSGVGVTTVLPNLASTRLGSGMHAARGMKKLDAADIADAIVEGLRRGRTEVYVPPSLRPLSVLDIALPRRLRRLVHRAFGSDQIAQDFDEAERAPYQKAAGRPPRQSIGESQDGAVAWLLVERPAGPSLELTPEALESAALDDDLNRASSVLQEARESGLLNPRRAVPMRMQTAAGFAPIIGRLAQAVAETRSMAQTIRIARVPPERWDHEFREPWLDLLRRGGKAIADADTTEVKATRTDLTEFANRLAVDGMSLKLWPLDGALLVNIRNILDVLDVVAEAQPVQVPATMSA